MKARPIITLILGTTLAIASVYLTRNYLSGERSVAAAVTDIETVKDTLSRQQEQLQQLKTMIEAIEGNPDTALAFILSTEKSRIRSLERKIESIEVAISNDVERIIAIPTIQKELENIKYANQSELNNLRQEIGRIYDLAKWFLALMITTSVGFIGMAISSFFKN